jgi:MFS family permease
VTNAPTTSTSILRQPKAVWATAFAAVVAFMGIGLVDPILPAIAANLHASASQVSLLFTSYFLVISIAMLATGFVSSRLGAKRTLLIGLVLVVVFATLAGFSNSVAQLVGWRAGWGLGNALFVATALAVIVGAASGGADKAIMIYEAALGLGISAGPLLGAVLGDMNWRYPFFGTAALMAVGFIATAAFLGHTPKPAHTISLRGPLQALTHGGLRTTALSALFYNYAFFTILAFTPFVLHMDAHGIGYVFFGWGVMLAITSVFVAPRLQARFGAVAVLTSSLVLLAGLVVVMAYAPHNLLVAAVIASGALLGINNTLFTEAAMEISHHPRPVASSGYNFVRWFGGALGPYAASQLAEHVDVHLPYLVAAGALLVSAAFALGLQRYLRPHAVTMDIDALARPEPALT